MKYVILPLLILLAHASETFSQGCSDAGVCTIQGIKPESVSDSGTTKNNRILVGITFGMGQHKVLAFTPYAEYSRMIGNHFSLSGRFNYGFREGELAGTNSPADFMLSGSYTFLNHFTATAGIKIPLNDANKKKDGLPLPMNYQTSLGTIDLLLGFGYHFRRFSFTAGYQQPLTQNNNQFLATDYPEDSPEFKYYSTRKYHRASDVLLRLSAVAVQSKKFILIASILPIYHVKNDTYEDTTGMRITLSGSQGLTLNINAILQYRITSSQTLELNLGAPALARKVRPDGLSNFAVSLEYKISF